MKVVHLVRMNTLISLLSWIQNVVIKVGGGDGIMQQTGTEKYTEISRPRILITWYHQYRTRLKLTRADQKPNAKMIDLRT